jgi:hypothetical protein
MMKTITELLDQISDYQAMVDVITLDKQNALDAIYTPEIKAQLEAIEAEYAGKTETATAKITDLTAEVKDRVIAEGATVKGSHLMAVYVKGRESWDGKLLSGYAVAHPEILTARKVGEPSITIRKV